MRKKLLVAAALMSLCLTAQAEEQYQPNAESYKNSYPVFGSEDRTMAELGEHEDSAKKENVFAKSANSDLDDNLEMASGRVTKTAARKDMEKNDTKYALPKNGAGEKVAKSKAANTALPVHLFGDHVEFENATGDFVATGKVRIQQGPETMLTNYAFGNMKTGDIYLLEGGKLIEPSSYTEGKWVHYNYNTKTGEMKQMSGRGEKDFFKAPHALIMPDKIVADKGGMTTRCTAKNHVPCMHVEAKSIEFYPKEKMVAHEVKAFIKGKHIYSRKLWINEFKESRNLLKPSVGWDSKDNGWYVKLVVSEPLSKKDTARATLIDYSRNGFKPEYKYTHDERNWKFTYKYGWEEDDDNWYHKQNDFRFDLRPHYFTKKLPLNYSAYYEYGLWSKYDMHNGKVKPTKSSTNGKSWHREYAYYINHNPIKLFGPDTTLHLTYGRKWVHESATKATKTTNMYYTTLRQKVDSNKRLWVSYLREKVTSNLFNISQPDMARELRIGLQWAPTHNDIFSVVDRYNVGERAVKRKNGVTTRQYETTYNWYHRFCCWALQLTYEKEWYKKDHSLKAQFFFYNW